MALAIGACFILSKLSDDSASKEDQLINIQGSEGLTLAMRTAVFYSDNAIAGYLLICVSIAFLTIASLEEVLAGTENKLIRTKFNEASNLHLFVESTYMVICLIQLVHIGGPILGGALNAKNDSISMTCFNMSQFGLGCLTVYFLLSVFVYCTVHHENELKLEEDLSGRRRDAAGDLEGMGSLGR